MCIGKAGAAIDILSTIRKSDFSNKVNCSRISATIWLHHLGSNKIPREKARWKLHQDFACCFKQIIEVVPYKTANVRPLTSNLIKHPRSKNELTSDLLLWTSTHRHTTVGRLAKTYLYQLCVDTECRLEQCSSHYQTWHTGRIFSIVPRTSTI